MSLLLDHNFADIADIDTDLEPLLPITTTTTTYPTLGMAPQRPEARAHAQKVREPADLDPLAATEANNLLREECERWKTLAINNIDRVERLETAKRELTAEVAKIKDASHLDLLLNDLWRAQDDSHRVHRDLLAEQDEKHKLQDRMKDLEIDLKIAQQNQDIMIRNRESATEIRRGEIASADHQLDQKNVKIQKLEDEIAGFQTEKSQYRTTEKEIKQLQLQLSRVTAMKNRSEEALKTRDEKIAELELSVQDISTEKADLFGKAEQRFQLEQTLQDYQRRHVDCDRKDIDRLSLQQQITEASTNLERKDARIVDLEREISKLNRQLEQDKQKTQTDAEATNVELVKLRRDFQGMEEKWISAKREVATKDTEIDTTQLRLNRSTEHFQQEICEKNKEHSREMEAKDAEIKRLKEEYNSLHTIYIKFTSEFNQDVRRGSSHLEEGANLRRR